MGEERFAAARALGKALAEAQWRLLTIDFKNPLTIKTLKILARLRHHAEVDQFLKALYEDPEHVDSRQWHYLKRKYEDGVEFTGIEDIDRRIEQILSDKESTVYHPGEHYHVVSSDQRWIAVIAPSGIRVSLMIAMNVKRLGQPLCTLRDLIR